MYDFSGTQSCKSCLPGCQELVIDEGSCKQKPGCGVSGQIQGQPVSIGSQEYVREQLHPGEHSAADRFLEASTSATSGNMQANAPQPLCSTIPHKSSLACLHCL